MADTNKNDTPNVAFDAAPALEAESGSDNVMFKAEEGLGEESVRTGATQTFRDGANKLGAKATEQFRTLAGDGKERAAGGLAEVSTLMRDAATSVDERLGAQYGQYARSAADQIDGLANTLRTKELDELIDDARAFVRKSPAVAIGVAAGIGFVLARLVKSGVDAVADQADKTDRRA